MTALDTAMPLLRCPVCASTLHRTSSLVTCANGHTFDVARQGYLNLTVGRAHHATGDTAAMVRAREQVMDLHFGVVRDAVADAVAAGARRVIDVGGGTGHYLVTVLDRLPAATGVCLDLSTAALRRAARAHDRCAAVGADVWRTLPIADACVDTALNVFAPRNAAEIERVLVADGRLVLVSPLPDHLDELRRRLRLLSVDPDKDRREHSAFARFTRTEVREIRQRIDVTRDDAVALAQMGPAGKHADEATVQLWAAQLPEQLSVTIAARVQQFRVRT